MNFTQKFMNTQITWVTKLDVRLVSARNGSI